MIWPIALSAALAQVVHGGCSHRAPCARVPRVMVWIIVVITFFATASLVLGLKRGIQSFSMIAFGLSPFILLGVLFMDHTWYILPFSAVLRTAAVAVRAG